MHAARPVRQKNEAQRIRLRVTRQPAGGLSPSPRGWPILTAHPLPQARSSLPARLCAGWHEFR